MTTIDSIRATSSISPSMPALSAAVRPKHDIFRSTITSMEHAAPPVGGPTPPAAPTSKTFAEAILNPAMDAAAVRAIFTALTPAEQDAIKAAIYAADGSRSTNPDFGGAVIRDDAQIKGALLQAAMGRVAPSSAYFTNAVYSTMSAADCRAVYAALTAPDQAMVKHAIWVADGSKPTAPHNFGDLVIGDDAQIKGPLVQAAMASVAPTFASFHAAVNDAATTPAAVRAMFTALTAAEQDAIKGAIYVADGSKATHHDFGGEVIRNDAQIKGALVKTAMNALLGVASASSAASTAASSATSVASSTASTAASSATSVASSAATSVASSTQAKGFFARIASCFSSIGKFFMSIVDSIKAFFVKPAAASSVSASTATSVASTASTVVDPARENLVMFSQLVNATAPDDSAIINFFNNTLSSEQQKQIKQKIYDIRPAAVTTPGPDYGGDMVRNAPHGDAVKNAIRDVLAAASVTV